MVKKLLVFLTKNYEILVTLPVNSMANDYFRFKQFTLRQDRCGMKVGTDGTLLGAWANGGSDILDVGTGTGLIALMMAQRFPQSRVKGVDIDAEACRQAAENVAASPFAVEIDHADFKDVEGSFDCIVSNPPFFIDSLQSPDRQRTLARHTSSLTFEVLLRHAYQLLRDDGELSVIVPAEGLSRMDSAASLTGFFKSRQCAVRTTERKAPRRFLLAYRKHPTAAFESVEGVLQTSVGERTEWYHELTKDFYL